MEFDGFGARNPRGSTLRRRRFIAGLSSLAMVIALTISGNAAAAQSSNSDADSKRGTFNSSAQTELASKIAKDRGGIETRIINGKTANRSQTPWFTQLFFMDQDRNTYLCGGTAISKRWIVTAAHCLFDQHSGDMIAGVAFNNPTKINTGTQIPLESYRIHSQYNEYDVGSPNDIAIVKTKSDMNVTPLAYPKKTASLPPGALMDVYGFGKTQSASHSTKLLTTQVKEQFNPVTDKCGEWAPSEFSNSKMICAMLVKSGKLQSVCSGDSGGPLTRGTGNSRRLVGIVSWGEATCTSTIRPAAYTRVTAFSDWIQNHTKIKPDTVPAKLTATKPFKKGRYLKLKRKKKMTIKIKNSGGQTGKWTIEAGTIGKTKKGSLAKGKSKSVSYRLRSRTKKCQTVKVLHGSKSILKFKAGLNGKKC